MSDDYGLGLKVHEDAYHELELELAAMTEQRDRLAEAATVLVAAKGRHNTMLAYEKLSEALAAVKGGSDEISNS